MQHGRWKCGSNDEYFGRSETIAPYSTLVLHSARPTSDMSCRLDSLRMCKTRESASKKWQAGSQTHESRHWECAEAAVGRVDTRLWQA